MRYLKSSTLSFAVTNTGQRPNCTDCRMIPSGHHNCPFSCSLTIFATIVIIASAKHARGNPEIHLFVRIDARPLTDYRHFDGAQHVSRFGSILCRTPAGHRAHSASGVHIVGCGQFYRLHLIAKLQLPVDFNQRNVIIGISSIVAGMKDDFIDFMRNAVIGLVGCANGDCMFVRSSYTMRCC